MITAERIVHITTTNSTGPSRMAVHCWGPESGQPLLYIHGLTGNGLEFAYAARALGALGYHVIAPDMPGRGLSDDLKNPEDYRYQQYLIDINTVLDSFGYTAPLSVDWVGTSMGGLIGFRAAAAPQSRVRRLVLNDIGPEVPVDALDFIRSVLKITYIFDTQDALAAFMRQTREFGFGPMDDAAWNHYALAYSRPRHDGRVMYAYDPRIDIMFDREPCGEIPLWSSWDALTIPVLTLRGAKSLVFPASIADMMKTRGPGPTMELVTFDDCGHVPPLVNDDQINVLTAWLKPATA
jgi:pimeloyl-ACP methyl ester carboxylesterase